MCFRYSDDFKEKATISVRETFLLACLAEGLARESRGQDLVLRDGTRLDFVNVTVRLVVEVGSVGFLSLRAQLGCKDTLSSQLFQGTPEPAYPGKQFYESRPRFC